MDLNDENIGKDLGNQADYPMNNLKIERVLQFEDEEDEKAYGVYLDDNLLGVFWNEELAMLFKDAADSVQIIVKE